MATLSGQEEIIRMHKINPLRGHIVPVPTVQETRPSVEFGDAYAVEIIQKCAAQVSKLLDSTYPKDPSLPFNHVRRFAKENFLPEAVRLKIETEKKESLLASSEATSVETSEQDVPVETVAAPATMFIVIPPPLPELEQVRELLAPFVPSYVSRTSTEGLLSEETRTTSSFPIHRITIPLQPPLNTQQADAWSKTYWPISFNAAFPRGQIAPPPKILGATKTNIAPKAGYYLSLAGKVATEAKREGRGMGIGVVVVDPAIASVDGMGLRDEPQEEEDNGVVAVAGDARYCAPGIEARTNDNSKYSPDCEGGPEFHAIMRAIEMVAMRRRAGDDTTIPTETASNRHMPKLTTLESYYLYRPSSSSQYASPSSSSPGPLLATDTATTTGADVNVGIDGNANTGRILPRTAGGYLCTDLDIYITHEPCLACSMGILLSRFRAITFRRRGRLVTGGLASTEIATATGDVESVEIHDKDDNNSVGNINDDDGGKNTIQNRETYYGLHWRKELNWRAMCFEFVDDEDDNGTMVLVDVEKAGDYHA